MGSDRYEGHPDLLDLVDVETEIRLETVAQDLESFSKSVPVPLFFDPECLNISMDGRRLIWRQTCREENHCRRGCDAALAAE